jgi:hypothetical protein
MSVVSDFRRYAPARRTAALRNTHEVEMGNGLAISKRKEEREP